MRENRKGDRTPFDMRRRPAAQYPFLMPLIWGLSWIQMRRFELKIERIGMKEIHPPYLVLAAHQGESDYCIAPLALFPHRANYVSDVEGFAAYGNWLYRGIGCIGKRRYVPDYTVIANMRHVLRRGHSVVVYPESRHSNVGTTALIPKNMGRLAKHLGVPLVTLSVHGSYLANPFWDERHTRTVPIHATLECIYTAEKLKLASESEVQHRIEEKLCYDEYHWQQEQHLCIDMPARAEGLHKALYQCRRCGMEFSMETSGAILRCRQCGSAWTLSEYGWLCRANDKIHIPDWYEWQRKNVCCSIAENGFSVRYAVTVEALYNAKGFVPLGEGILIGDMDGFTLQLKDSIHRFRHAMRESVQTEYDYKGKGMCIVLSDHDCCYYIYTKDAVFNPTKLQFAGEYLHSLSMQNKQRRNKHEKR